MKHLYSIGLIAATFFVSLASQAQTKFNTQKIGHVINFSVPEYMTRTTGISDDAFLQYKSVPKDVYTYLIEDSKVELAIVELTFPTTRDFYDFVVKDFLKDEEKLKVGTPIEMTVDGVKYVQCDFSYYDKQAEGEIFYCLTIAELEGYFYQIYSYTAASNTDAIKADMRKMATTLKDIKCN
jgi:hypothetical protein